MSSEKIGPTGEYPQGKLNADDAGELQMFVGIEGDCVRIEFGTAVKWCAMDEWTALELGAKIISAALTLRNCGRVHWVDGIDS
jgi:hypothetical protein